MSQRRRSKEENTLLAKEEEEVVVVVAAPIAVLAVLVAGKGILGVTMGRFRPLRYATAEKEGLVLKVAMYILAPQRR